MEKNVNSRVNIRDVPLGTHVILHFFQGILQCGYLSPFCLPSNPQKVSICSIPAHMYGQHIHGHVID